MASLSSGEQHNPRPVQVTRADQVKTGHGQTDGMIRQVCAIAFALTISLQLNPEGGAIQPERSQYGRVWE
ncbi:uncharacterized protein Z519_12402 [Cladophialophora bantiana CBS 173.52]|uniref:Uncharacterized protein n=1 Tax=Cladophialophora bantiana (strain ATCC 10958 / CBS 173.52 / CDC B-1940 / NIH 8579) TaxID=1442370 RepID=A0A0D2FJR3_CLAB1|nr:uncharacterized protein Z519_12402 [Cladophialophora bantiana CBS 173.52]KIW86937.1 hypothetical protein Z519_12402 [Cladophialophora bantiana CBS 173.52]